MIMDLLLSTCVTMRIIFKMKEYIKPGSWFCLLVYCLVDAKADQTNFTADDRNKTSE